MEIRSAEALREVLSQPLPTAVVEGAFARAPEVRCYLGPCSLGQVLRWSLGPAALAWRDGVVRHDPHAAAHARLQAVCLAEPQGTPLFAGDGRQLLESLPAGVVDRLLYASDRATGYAPPAESETHADLSLAYAVRPARCVAGLFPQAPEAALFVHAYDLATLAAVEEAALAAVPGGAVRLDLLAWPTLLAATVRAGAAPDDPLILDESLARQLPHGAARAIVETADILAEMGGPAAAVRFLRSPEPRGLDDPGAVAPAAHGPLPQ